MQDIFTGILYVNAGTTGAEIHLPFGGTKATGNGHREAGTAAIDFFTEWQSHLRRLQRQPPARPDRRLSGVAAARQKSAERLARTGGLVGALENRPSEGQTK